MIEQDCNASTSRSLILTISETPIACILNFIHYPVTGRRCPHSGEGEDFLTGQLNFFTETAVTPERKVEKSFPRWEMNGLSEGSERAVDQSWGRMEKSDFPRFWAPKKDHFCTLTMLWPRPEKVGQRKKVVFSQINISLLKNFGCFFGLNPFLAKKPLFCRT